MVVELRDSTLEALAYICANLRERDKQEIFALRWEDNHMQLAADTFACGALQQIAFLDGEPVAVVGAHPMWPGVWSVFAFGTDKWSKVVLALTRYVRTFIIPALYNGGCRRAQCFALETHTDARRWLELLGATAEVVLPDFGKDGETFVLYSWDRFRTRSNPLISGRLECAAAEQK
jgi:hypothetical protein